ncbi:MAG TPA: hypothetical protein VGG16_22070 [Streptosporangiaceae bacterium]|jgi:hypothetical protein
MDRTDKIQAPEVSVDPGGDAGWDGPPLDIDVPDDARELERDVIAYHREQRALRRRRRVRKFLPGQAGIMPLMASILAVCLVAGMMLSVFTITPTDGPGRTRPATSQPTAPQPRSATSHPAAPSSSGRQSPAASTSASATQVPSPRTSGHASSSGAPRAQSSG